MALTKKPVTGMKDILPKEMQIRDYVQSVIKQTYASFGFTSIETPAVEHIENLNCKQGGENEKLIFKILKRGEKLSLQDVQNENDLVDGGLRYDLTVPLARFYSAHASELPTPFKALQMGSVWRADKPQRGRYRQFVQCDIDILGEPSNLAEIELILATSSTVAKLGFHDFKIRLNDRRILKAMAYKCGFEESMYDTVFIILDKMDKIGLDGVKEELLESGFMAQVVEKYISLYDGISKATDVMAFLKECMEDGEGAEAFANLSQIMESVNLAKSDNAYEVCLDPTLVRGMSYYTGTIFEIEIPQFGGSCGGGGRYDKMIGKFTGSDVPACGFSIGFERIVLLLTESGFTVPELSHSVCYLIEKGVDSTRLGQIIADAEATRKTGARVLVVRMNKNKKFQKEQLTKEGYAEFKEFYEKPLA